MMVRYSTAKYLLKLRRLAPALGLLGVSILFLGILLAGLEFRDSVGRGYSPLNHFVSELGWFGMSSGALFFNLCIVGSSACLMLFMLGTTTYLPRNRRHYSAGLGALTCVSSLLTGVIPINNLHLHLAIALIFFFSGLTTIASFSAYLMWFSDRKVSRWIMIFGLVSVTCFGLFLAQGLFACNRLAAVIRTFHHRPHFWLLPFLEWLAVLSLLGWIVILAANLNTLKHVLKR